METTALTVSNWIISPLVATVAFWTCFGACVEAPQKSEPPIARVVASWDPLACGEPHRVVIELEDEDSVPLSGSTPCALGELMLDVPHFGVYRGRIYAWAPDAPIRSVTPIDATIDQAIVRWTVATPP